MSFRPRGENFSNLNIQHVGRLAKFSPRASFEMTFLKLLEIDDYAIAQVQP